ncbi:MAG: response regulator transcription factor [Rhodospirillales bacterium]|nr:response regulator transcription factor [Rhodospirillales bacterium]
MTEPTVFVVDDDEAVRHCLGVLLRLAGLKAETFSDGMAFLDAWDPERPGCLVLDARMPKMSGIEVQRWMGAQEVPLPVIIITGHGDLAMAVTAFREGVFDFLEKPFDDAYFVERVKAAIDRDAETRRRRERNRSAAAKLRGLSPREREVMELMVEGCANKTIAARLGIGVRTVEGHRAHVMRKLDVTSLSELTRLRLSLDGDTLK